MAENLLKKDLEAYLKNKVELTTASEGKFVLIKGDAVIGVYDTQNDAIKVGTDKFGNTPFLVKKIQEIEETHNYTSNLIRAGLTCPL